ncbi:MAG: hypothetical protein AAB512_02960 [Patescibacteria group bacterium]
MDKITLLSLSNDLKRIVTSIQRGSNENSQRFTQEAKHWLEASETLKQNDYLTSLLKKIKVTLNKKDGLEKAEDCLMYSVLIQNHALFSSN